MVLGKIENNLLIIDNMFCSLFVQQNYQQIKQKSSHLTHKEVMNLLSQKYHETNSLKSRVENRNTNISSIPNFDLRLMNHNEDELLH